MASYRVVARLAILDPANIELTALKLVVSWESKRSCCVGIPVITSYKGTATAYWYRYLFGWGGWEFDKNNSWVRVTEGGLGKRPVGIKAHQGFDYFGLFTAICPLCYNTLEVSIVGHASGKAGCTFNPIIKQNPPPGFLHVGPRVCRFD